TFVNSNGFCLTAVDSMLASGLRCNQLTSTTIVYHSLARATIGGGAMHRLLGAARLSGPWCGLGYGQALAGRSLRPNPSTAADCPGWPGRHRSPRRGPRVAPCPGGTPLPGLVAGSP